MVEDFDDEGGVLLDDFDDLGEEAFDDEGALENGNIILYFIFLILYYEKNMNYCIMNTHIFRNSFLLKI